MKILAGCLRLSLTLIALALILACRVSAQAPPGLYRYSGFFYPRWTCGPGADPRPTFWLMDGRNPALELEGALPGERSIGRIMGKWVTVEGNHSPGADVPFHVDRLQIGPAPPSSGADHSGPGVSAPTQFGTKRYVTILIRFSDATNVTPRPVSYYEALMGDTAPAIGHYWQDQSYGQVRITGSVVVGWVNLPHPRSYYEDAANGGALRFTELFQDAVSLVDAQVYFPDYYGINLLCNENAPGGFWGVAGGVGLTVDGVTRGWGAVIGNPEHYHSMIAHEMGHTLGMGHGGGPDGSQYGDGWDPMGHGTIYSTSLPYVSHAIGISSYHRQSVGWIPAALNYLAFPGTDANVEIERLCNPVSTTNPLMAIIFIGGSASDYYTIETRLASGYDALAHPPESLNGLPGQGIVIHRVNWDWLPTSPEVRVVDGDGNGDGDDSGGVWTIGETFNDSANQIKVEVWAAGATSMTVHITVGPASPRPDTIVSTQDKGPGTLRNALTFANLIQGTPLWFAIPATDPGKSNGTFVIRPLSALPTIDGDGTFLDGGVQTTLTGDTNPEGPEVYVDGSEAGENINGLWVNASGCTIRNLGVGGYRGHGIVLWGWAGASNTRLQGLYVGVGPSGKAPLGNAWSGIRLHGGTHDNVIGGTTADTRNVLSANGNAGVHMSDAGTSRNLVLGNFLGTDATGTLALGNGWAGVGVNYGATGNTIGGTTASARNLISGNRNLGVSIADGATSGNVVLGNYIGTDVSGTLPLPNTWGIELGYGTHDNRVGDGTPAGRNVISGNVALGVGLHTAGTTANQVNGNIIGPGADGRAGLKQGLGVYIVNGAVSNVIGSEDGLGNTIAFNDTGVGVWDAATTGNRLLRNLVYANTYLGFNLVGAEGAFGVTPNDAGDGDTGPNNLQNFPVVTAVNRGAASADVRVTLSSRADRDFRIELFSTGQADPSGYGEGEEYVGSAIVRTDSSGNARVTVTAPIGGSYVCATAADVLSGDTSEFGPALFTTPGPPSNLTAAPKEATRIALAWEDHSLGETGFRVERREGTGAYSQIAAPGANSTAYIDSAVQSETSYTYRVRAYNAAGDSEPSNEATAQPGQAGPNSPSSLTAATKSQTEIALAWKDNSDIETGFSLERRKGDGSFALAATLAANRVSHTDGGLEADTAYTYRLRASNATANSSYSNEAGASTLPYPPTAPTGLAAESRGPTTVHLTWRDTSDNESGFAIERKKGDGSFREIARVDANATASDDTTAAANSSYTYRVRGFNAGGSSGYSNEASATTPRAVPAAPAALTAEPVSDVEIALTWNDNSYGADAEDGFKIERRKGNSSFAEINTVAANTTGYSDPGLEPSTQYTYRVRAYNTTGDSGYSNEAASATKSGLPDPPTGLTAAVVSRGRIDHSWTDRSDNETGFELQKSANGGSTWTALVKTAADVTGYGATGLTPNTTYWFRVRAFNARGNSAWNGPVTATTLPNPPAAPSDLVLKPISVSEIDLSWADRSDNEQGFKVERKQADGSFAELGTVGADVTSFADRGLKSNTAYTYRVRAYNTGGSSDYTPPVTASTLPDLPAQPTDLAVQAASQSQLDVTWRDRSSNETGFELQESTDGGTGWHTLTTTGPSVTLYAHKDLAANSTHTYRVRAVNADGASDWAGPVTAATLPNLPAPPTDPKAESLSDTQIRLTWKHSGVDVDGFRVERKNGTDSFTLVSSPVAAAREYTDTGLTANFTYTYRLKAHNRAGESTPSGETSATTLPKLGGSLAISPGKVSFGKVKVGTRRLALMTLTNSSSTERLSVSVGKLKAPFSLQKAVAPTILAPGEKVTVRRLFTPKKKGKVTGSLAISSSDPRRPKVSVALSGTGV
jgi:M6 family metalloprotease-like protein